MNLLDWHPLYFLNRYFSADFQFFEGGFSAYQKNQGFAIEKLNWDSNFFGKNIYKWKFWDGKKQPDFPDLAEGQIFIEAPSEAAWLFPNFQKLGFSLVETRLTYFHLLQNLPGADQKSRFAGLEDIEPLQKVASEAVNPFDRYHADPFFSEADANRYLETYIANCINGFAEKVIVPDLQANPASFVALSRLKEPQIDSGALFRIPLTACLSENKGWHYHLCLSALHYAKEESGKCLVMTTQSTNGAVIHNCEKLGFKLGSVFHIFSKSFF